MTETDSSRLLERAKRYRWYIFWVLSGGYILVYFHRLCPAVVALDMMRDLKTGGALTGFLGAAYFYPYAVMQLPAGLLSDTWGPRKTITLFLAIAFVGSVLLGAAPTALWAIVGRSLVGLGVAMLFVPTLKILAEWFHKSEFAFMTGILMAMGGVGSLSAATPLALMSNWVGWRASFVVVGGITLVLGALVWLVVRDRPAAMGWPSPADIGSDPGSTAAPAIGLAKAVATVVKHPRYWVLATWFFFTGALMFSFGGLWGGPYLIQIYGYSKTQAGQILSMLAVGMIIGSPLLSYLSDKVFKGRKPVLIMCSIVCLVVVAALAFYTNRIPPLGLYLLCLATGIFCFAAVVIGFTANKELFPVQMAGTATGLINLFPFASGAVFQPMLGYFLQRAGTTADGFTLTGYRHAFLVLFISGLIALVASFFVQETLARDKVSD